MCAAALVARVGTWLRDEEATGSNPELINPDHHLLPGVGSQLTQEIRIGRFEDDDKPRFWPGTTILALAKT
jgi:hypothetical protein